MHFQLSSIIILLILVVLANQGHAANHHPKPKLEQQHPECAFPRLKERLMRMINFNDPFAFEVILLSECRGRFDSSHHHHIQLFDHLLSLSVTRDVSRFLKVIMKDESYSPLMFRTWTNHRPLLSHPVLVILKANFKHPDSSKIFTISLEYPIGSPERHFLNSWLVNLQRPMLNWPFASSNSNELKESLSASPVKSKSFKLASNPPQSWSDFENVPGIIKSIESAQVETKTPHTTLRFGHIYGWISRRNRPTICNSQDLFHLCGHAVKLQDTFLSFASPKFPLEKYANSAKNPSKSFFELSNCALRQKLTQSAKNKNFAACRLKGSGSGELQAMLKGDLMLVVLGQREGGEYDYKYPENPYDNLINGSRDLHDLSIEVKPTDIVLFLPRSLFSNQEQFITPHDIPGSFHHTELSTFAGTFVNFINYVHSKTRHRGLIAVGGFVHIN